MLARWRRTILGGMDKNRMPSAARIEAAAAWLLAKGDRRSVVQLVERWAEVAEPTPKARLAQAEAWFGLGLADRAWMSLKELVEPAMSDVNAPPLPGQYEAFKLAGVLFVDRGWSAKARRPLELAMSVAPSREAAESVKVLLARVDEPPVELPAEPPAGAEDVAGLVLLAQRHLVAGAQIKARRLLERARRIDPENVRAEHMLWALGGDYSGTDATLAELVERAIPDIGGSLPVLSDITEETDDRTEESDRDALSEAEDKSKSFPTLFRGAKSETEHEGTASMRMAELGKLETIEPPTDGASVAGDTQIARVIRRGEGVELEAALGPIHSGIEEPSKDFDLAAFRREMGMDVTPAVARSDYDAGFEDEDISRVVRIAPLPPENTDSTTGGFLEQLEPDTSGDMYRAAPGPEAPTSSGVSPAASPPTASRPPAPRLPESKPARTADPVAPGGTPRPIERRPTPAGKRRRRVPMYQWYVLAIGLVLLFGATVLFLLMLVTFLKG